MASPRAGAAYLALVTGAPVVPVAFLGHAAARRLGRLAATAGRPARDDLRRAGRPRQQPLAAHPAGHVRRGGRVTDAILKTIRTAERETGMTLPGPIGPRREKKKTA